MENHDKRRVLCPENEELASYMLQKQQEMLEKPRGLSENLDMTLSRAYNNVCNAKNHIKTLKDLSEIKGVGKWILKLVQEFFDATSGSSEPEDLTEKGKASKATKNKGTKRYVPHRNSVAYALLITLYRGTANGNEFMRRQELIDAAEASGLSRAAIMPEKGKGKPGQFGCTPRDWYSGWSCMKTLIIKGLVVKSSCPARYMLTQEGREAACECLMRSGLTDSIDILPVEQDSDLDTCDTLDLELANSSSSAEVTLQSVSLSQQSKSADVQLASLERFTRMGYSKEQVLHAFNEEHKTSSHKEISSLWPAVLCRLREDQVHGLHPNPQNLRQDCHVASTICAFTNSREDVVRNRSTQIDSSCDGGNMHNLSAKSVPKMRIFKACSSVVCAHIAVGIDVLLSSFESMDYSAQKSWIDGLQTNMNVLSMPPLSFGERFEDAYEVILILDDREQFATQGSRSRRIIENICLQFKIRIEVRRLPVGDGIWIARHKQLDAEYVLDFIVERKKVDDLRSSIRDNRYRDQKLRLLRCGLKKLIYLVEGDPNSSEASESLKTACFTTEILEGFDVQRTSGLADTLRKYGYLTQSITQFYKLELPDDQLKRTGICPPFNEFVKRCQDLDKMTVSDVFATQLMQVPQVTEEIAIAVLDLYPTLLSLAHAYSFLEGDSHAQEEMLMQKSNNVVSAVASRNIFQLVWGN